MDHNQQDGVTARDLSARLVDCLNRRDYAGLSSAYAEEAMIMPPGHETLVGRRGIEAFWRVASEFLADVEVETPDVQLLGPDVLLEQGRLSFSSPDARGKRTTGKYLVSWARMPSRWCISRDIWNLDA